MATQPSPLRIFCGYAHKDKALFQQLKTALAVLIRQEAVSMSGPLLPPKWNGLLPGLIMSHSAFSSIISSLSRYPK